MGDKPYQRPELTQDNDYVIKGNGFSPFEAGFLVFVIVAVGLKTICTIMGWL